MPSPPREKPARLQGLIPIICPTGNSGRPGAVREASMNARSSIQSRRRGDGVGSAAPPATSPRGRASGIGPFDGGRARDFARSIRPRISSASFP
jgi:hypothetical protein